MTQEPNMSQPQAEPQPAPTPAPQAPAPRSSLRRVIVWTGAVLVALLGGGTAFLYWPPHSAAHVTGPDGAMPEDDDSDEGGAMISVNTIIPERKTLERTLTLPGSVKPWAQAEIYAKASGYLRSVGRETTPEMVASLTADAGLATIGSGQPLGGILSLLASAAVQHDRAPQKDIGSHVRAGEVLLEIASPEREQDVVARESTVEQREAELEQAKTVIATFQAAVESAKASKLQAEADIKKAEAEYTFREKELVRLRDLARSRTLSAELADEKQFQVGAAFAALESARAKAQTAQAEITAVSSKLATAKADLKVKETLVRVARDELQHAHILADYARMTSPFDGVITSRSVDEGDFIQNSTTGQTRLLMTVTSIDRVRVVLQVPASDAVWVRPGAPATVRVDERSSWEAKGHVARMDYVLESQSRTMRVEIDLDNRDRKLLPGMYGEVTLTLQEIPDALAIPAKAVYSRKGTNYILEVNDGVVTRHPVHILFDDGKQVEVAKVQDGKEEPLTGNEELVVSNKGEIAEGQHVTTQRLHGD